MAGKMAAVLILCVAAAVLAVGVRRAEAICNMSSEGMEACKPAVTAPEPAEPTQECCAALGGADLDCLCSYRHSLLLPSLGIDPELAMQLPKKCGLTPPQDCS